MVLIKKSSSQEIPYVDGSSPQQAIIAQLKKIPLFAGVDDIGLKKVISAFQIYSVPRGQTILSKGAVGEYLLFLFSGRLDALDMTDNEHVPSQSFVLAVVC